MIASRANLWYLLQQLPYSLKNVIHELLTSNINFKISLSIHTDTNSHTLVTIWFRLHELYRSENGWLYKMESFHPWTYLSIYLNIFLMIFNKILYFLPQISYSSFLRFSPGLDVFVTSLSGIFCQINACPLLLLIVIKLVIEYYTYFQLSALKSVSNLSVFSECFYTSWHYVLS